MKPKEAAQIYERRINQVINYIRDHLTETLTLDRLARLAHFSPFHFHRIFRSFTGEPLHSCVKRLRLEAAIVQMLHGPKTTLTKIALSCGFASSSDFSRAFKQAYGFSPRDSSRERFLEESKIRQDLLANSAYLSGGFPDSRNPDRFRVRLVDRPALRIAYVRVIGTSNPQRVLDGFNKLMAWGRQRDLIPGAKVIGMSRDNPEITPMKKYHFDWCLVIPADLKVDAKIELGLVHANRFAVLHCKGDIHKEGRTWNYLFHSWLPRSGYQPTHDPAMEIYRRNPLDTGWSQFDMDCCVPVKPLGRR